MITIVPCGKRKREGKHPAADLYVGPYFTKAKAAAIALGHPWLIMSAMHGLLVPDQPIEHYDLPLGGQNPDHLRRTVRRQVRQGMIRPGDLVIDLTPAAYHRLLVEACPKSQRFLTPLVSLGQGRAMHVMMQMAKESRVVTGAEVYGA